MKFTKGLFVGTALGISAAMMMNNKTKMTNTTNTEGTYTSSNNTTGITAPTEAQTNNYIDNDII